MDYTKRIKMGIAIGIIFWVFEIIILALLFEKIKRYKSLTIKDTIVYPLLLIMTFVMMIIARSLYSQIGFLSLIRD